MTTNKARFTREIKSWIVMAKIASNKKANLTKIKGRNKLSVTFGAFEPNPGHFGKQIRNFGVWCWRRMERISWTDRVRNE